jgi:hypothetical protein
VFSLQHIEIARFTYHKSPLNASKIYNFYKQYQAVNREKVFAIPSIIGGRTYEYGGG